MPGPVSDSYDPEWGSSENAQAIMDEIDELYTRVSIVLGQMPPIFILDLVAAEDLNRPIPAVLSEKDWRLIRFCIERAKDAI